MLALIIEVLGPYMSKHLTMEGPQWAQGVTLTFID